MNNKNHLEHFYNATTFRFFRRHIDMQKMNKVFTDLIHAKSNKNLNNNDNNNNQQNFSKNNKNKSRNVFRAKHNRLLTFNTQNANDNKYSNNLNLALYFQKNSLDMINKIRDLFIGFDKNKSDTFDQFELLKMFNANKIPLTQQQIIYIFGFTRFKRELNFLQFLNLSLDSDFQKRFKKTIEKIKPLLEEGVICPVNFQDMLSHLCEFGMMSSNNDNKNITEFKRKHHTQLAIKLKKKIKDNSIKKIKYGSCNHLKINKNEFEEKVPILKKNKEFAENQKKIAKSLETVIEFSHKKISRSVAVLKIYNTRARIDNAHKNLLKSLEIIHKINPEIDERYISFSPLNQGFTNLKTGKSLSFVCDKNNGSNYYCKTGTMNPFITNMEKDNIKQNISIENDPFFKGYFLHKMDKKSKSVKGLLSKAKTKIIGGDLRKKRKNFSLKNKNNNYKLGNTDRFNKQLGLPLLTLKNI